MTVARRRLTGGYDAWCDPATGELVLAEGLTPSQELAALRQVAARLLGDPAGSPDAVPLTREQAVRPDLYLVLSEAAERDEERAG